MIFGIASVVNFHPTFGLQNNFFFFEFVLKYNVEDFLLLDICVTSYDKNTKTVQCIHIRIFPILA